MGNLPNGWTDWHQMWHTYADSSGNEHRVYAKKRKYPLDTPGVILRGLYGQKLKSGKCGQTAGLIPGCCVCPRSHPINNFMVSPVNWIRIPVVAGFVVLCGADIVENIISAEEKMQLSRAKPGNPASNIIIARVDSSPFALTRFCKTCAVSSGI